MGWFNWLFGRKKKAPQVSTAAAPPKPSVPVPQAVDDPDEDWAEATTFISVRLSPIAHRPARNKEPAHATWRRHSHVETARSSCHQARSGSATD